MSHRYIIGIFIGGELSEQWNGGVGVRYNPHNPLYTLLTYYVIIEVAIREVHKLQVLKVSPPNTKLKQLIYSHNYYVESVSLLSGHTCPYALLCMAKVHKVTRKIEDGKFAEHRCFSTSNEAAFSTVYNARLYNTELFQACKTEDEICQLLDFSIRKSFDPFRIHIGGEFYNQMYFDAWCKFASDNPYRVFYAYTKSLPYWINRLGEIPSNLSLTASYGGRADNLIERYNLKSALVVNHPEVADKLQLEIDHDDSHAIANDNKSFALLIHGIQKAGSKSADAIKRMNSEKIKYRYSKVG